MQVLHSILHPRIEALFCVLALLAIIVVQGLPMLRWFVHVLRVAAAVSLTSRACCCCCSHARSLRLSQ